MLDLPQGRDFEGGLGADEPDYVHIGSVKSIPIIENDDPRFETERAERRAAAAAADAMHSPEELQQGLSHANPEVRWRVVSRLVARGLQHPDTLPRLLDGLESDPSPHVRSSIAGNLHWFEARDVTRVLRSALTDPDEDVRDAARDVLAYFGQDDENDN